MSANLVIDLRNTTDYKPSLTVGSGASLTVGAPIDLLQANAYCNVFVAAGLGGSGAIQVTVQTSDDTVSGNFTDPTSGIPAGSLPTVFLSGGIFITNSGLWVSGNYSESAVVDSAPLFCSGGIDFAAFQRPQRYARLILNSGVFPGAIMAGFISAKKTTGSGGGSSQQPLTGVPFV